MAELAESISPQITSGTKSLSSGIALLNASRRVDAPSAQANKLVVINYMVYQTGGRGRASRGELGERRTRVRERITNNPDFIPKVVE